MEFSLSEILTATGGRLSGQVRSADEPLRIVTDSRECSAGSVLWALRGETHDGHSFVSRVTETVDACVVRNDWVQSQPAIPNGTFIEVPDTLQALADLGHWNRRRRPVQVVGITGSFGKTTTREMVAAVLRSCFSTHSSQKNFNNHFGVPLTLLGLQPRHEVAVVEMGASAVGEICRLSQIVAPDVGIITGIGRSHLARFGGLDSILEAKGELAEALPGRGVLMVSGDEPHSGSLARRATCRIVRVGSGPDNDLRATAVDQCGDRLEVTIDQTTYNVRIRGRHFARSVLFAVAAGRELGMRDPDIIRGLESFEPVQGRCTVQDLGNTRIINDSYNASPEAMQAGIALLADLETTGNRILICGDMLELGAQSAAFHEDIGIAAAQAGIDYVLAYGEFSERVISTAREAGLERDRLAAFDSLDQLHAYLQGILSGNDTILVKGSRGMRMERVIDWLTTHLRRTTNEVEETSTEKC